MQELFTYLSFYQKLFDSICIDTFKRIENGAHGIEKLLLKLK